MQSYSDYTIIFLLSIAPVNQSNAELLSDLKFICICSQEKSLCKNLLKH